ncbi:homoserine dehydrogenase [Vallitalea maricola]|uniref:Homoserine dehydrogenase n=1 Tax=Vallitalea maricola TaxID=3074433 RepID=A0ACB5UM82_9FIRM|nr:homoserine dehydrogenase [Vallitalea sp. AN17-2]
MIEIGLLGLGTVGSGVYEIIHQRRNYLQELLGYKIHISKVLVKNLYIKRNVDINRSILTDNAMEILRDKDIKIIVEAIGGTTDAYDYITEALRRGKHVVTANKAVVCKYFKEFIELAKKNNCAFLFEASVAGGIPIIKELMQNISQLNDISNIKGILNGTTNYILTKMFDNGLNYEEALKSAQELGFAEEDPTDDVEGVDIARKLCILSTIASKNIILLKNIKRSGITKIIPRDIELIKSLEHKIKFIGSFNMNRNNQYYGVVEPVLVKKDSIYYGVNEANNVVSIKGSNVGEIQLLGQGAGKKPTANAVVSDIINVIKGIYYNYDFDFEDNAKVTNIDFYKNKYYFRAITNDINDINIIKEQVKIGNIIDKIVDEKKSFSFITKRTSLNVIKDIAIDIQNYSNGIWYARIEK